MSEKGLVILGTLGCILIGVLGTLIAWFCGGKDLTGNAKDILKKMFNFQLSLTLVGIIISFIPIVNLLLLLFSLIGTVYVIKAFVAYNKNTQFNAPSFGFINIE
jgi:uncharacterized Tic20 family protein